MEISTLYAVKRPDATTLHLAFFRQGSTGDPLFPSGQRGSLISLSRAGVRHSLADLEQKERLSNIHVCASATSWKYAMCSLYVRNNTLPGPPIPLSARWKTIGYKHLEKASEAPKRLLELKRFAVYWDDRVNPLGASPHLIPT